MAFRQAESVAALVGARTAAAADSALAGLSGGAGAAVAGMRAAALALLAEIEAGLDFEDELPEARLPRAPSPPQRAPAVTPALAETQRSQSITPCAHERASCRCCRAKAGAPGVWRVALRDSVRAPRQADVAALRARLEALRADVERALATARRGQLLGRGLQARGPCGAAARAPASPKPCRTPAWASSACYQMR